MRNSIIKKLESTNFNKGVYSEILDSYFPEQTLEMANYFQSVIKSLYYEVNRTGLIITTHDVDLASDIMRSLFPVDLHSSNSESGYYDRIACVSYSVKEMLSYISHDRFVITGEWPNITTDKRLTSYYHIYDSRKPIPYLKTCPVIKLYADIPIEIDANELWAEIYSIYKYN